MQSLQWIMYVFILTLRKENISFWKIWILYELTLGQQQQHQKISHGLRSWSSLLSAFLASVEEQHIF